MRQQKNMKGRILFTGNGKVTLQELMENMPQVYWKKNCPPTERLFLNLIEEFRPHVIVACINQCMPGRLKMYDALELNWKEIPMIVIGNEEDINVFKNHISHEEMKLIPRPVVFEQFRKVLDQYVTRAIEKEEEEIQKQTEEDEIKAGQGRMDEDLMGAGDFFSGYGIMDERKSILVVDDDVRMLNFIKIYLQQLYEVIVVPSGKLALKFLSRKHADLVLLDYLMPDMDGPQVLKWIREESSCPDIPVIFLTGVSDREKVLRGLTYNPKGYLLKPVTRNDLLDRVAEALSSSS